MLLKFLVIGRVRKKSNITKSPKFQKYKEKIKVLNCYLPRRGHGDERIPISGKDRLQILAIRYKKAKAS